MFTQGSQIGAGLRTTGVLPTAPQPQPQQWREDEEEEVVEWSIDDSNHVDTGNSKNQIIPLDGVRLFTINYGLADVSDLATLFTTNSQNRAQNLAKAIDITMPNILVINECPFKTLEDFEDYVSPLMIHRERFVEIDYHFSASNSTAFVFFNKNRYNECITLKILEKAELTSFQFPRSKTPEGQWWATSVFEFEVERKYRDAAGAQVKSTNKFVLPSIHVPANGVLQKKHKLSKDQALATQRQYLLQSLKSTRDWKPDAPYIIFTGDLNLPENEVNMSCRMARLRDCEVVRARWNGWESDVMYALLFNNNKPKYLHIHRHLTSALKWASGPECQDHAGLLLDLVPRPTVHALTDDDSNPDDDGGDDDDDFWDSQNPGKYRRTSKKDDDDEEGKDGEKGRSSVASTSAADILDRIAGSMTAV